MCLLFGNSTVTWETRQLDGYLRFVSVAFGFHCGHCKTRYMHVSELFSFLKFVMSFLKGVVSILLLVGVVLNDVALSKFPQQNFHEIL